MEMIVVKEEHLSSDESSDVEDTKNIKLSSLEPPSSSIDLAILPRSVPGICTICDKPFTNLRRHFLGQHTEKTMQCHLCPSKFGTRVNLNRHMRTVHFEKPLKAYAQIIFSSEIHTCGFCDMKFSNSESLLVHQQKLHGEKNYMCSVCQQRFSCQRYLRRHEETHSQKTITCDICNRLFSCNATLKRHKKYSHVAKKIVKMECKICNMFFLSPHNLKMHMEGVHQIGKEKFECNECGLHFYNKYRLKIHIETEHFKRNCKDCSRSFGYWAYIIHRKTHDPSTQYKKCKVCQEDIWIEKYSEHVSNHKGPRQRKRHPCNICGKSLSNKGSYDDHVRIHSGERPFTCEFCEVTFKSKKHLKDHVANHTKEVRYSCKICDEGFTQWSQVRRHKRKAHPSESLLEQQTLNDEGQTVAE